MFSVQRYIINLYIPFSEFKRICAHQCTRDRKFMITVRSRAKYFVALFHWIALARNVLYYLHKGSKTSFLRETDGRKWLWYANDREGAAFLRERSLSRRAKSLLCHYHWFYKDTRAWPIFSHLSAPGTSICYCETSQLRMIPFAKDRMSFVGIQIVGHVKIVSTSFSQHTLRSYQSHTYKSTQNWIICQLNVSKISIRN